MALTIEGNIGTSKVYNPGNLKKLEGKSFDQFSPEDKHLYDRMLQELYGDDSYDEALTLQKKFQPKYNKSEVFDQNIALARANLFAPDREAKEQAARIEESSADAVGKAQNYSSSTSALLGTLADVTSNKNNALRGIATDNAALKQQKLAMLLGSNMAGAEEDDKAWNYNTNQPFQSRIQETSERNKVYEETKFNFGDFLGSVLGTAASFATGGVLGGGGGGGRKKKKGSVGSDSGGMGV